MEGCHIVDIIINADLERKPASSIDIIHYSNYYSNILACLAYDIDSPPLADLLRSYYGLEGAWLVATPIHWQATHNDALLRASAPNLKLSAHESCAWFEAFKEFIAVDGIESYYHNAHTWLINFAS